MRAVREFRLECPYIFLRIIGFRIRSLFNIFSITLTNAFYIGFYNRLAMSVRPIIKIISYKLVRIRNTDIFSKINDNGVR